MHMEVKMNLQDWLYTNKMSVTEFAKSLGVSRDWISRIINKGVKPGDRLARDISLATEGKVTEQELRK